MSDEINNDENLIDFLVANRIYPMYSPTGKVFFKKPKDLPLTDDKAKEITDKLYLKTKKDCKKVRNVVKSRLARLRKTQPIRKMD